MEPQQSSRIDLDDLKAQIVKKLGAHRSKWYFYHLNRLLTQNLSKNVFDKLCLRVLGRENLHLHNRFMRSILKNVCQAKTPPPLLHVSSQSKSAPQASNCSSQRVPIWSDGVLPVSPRKGRSGIRDRKLKDRHTPLGPNGKDVKNRAAGVDEASDKAVTSNGGVSLCDHRRPLKQLEAVQAISAPLLAPLGIPFCQASVGGARKGSWFGGRGDSVSFYDRNELPDSETLRRRMEEIVKAEGLEGVSSECAITLNKMVNLYLKRMIGSCIELVGVRSCYELPRIQKKGMNGAWKEQRAWGSVSLLDFKTAMELNPKQLGGDWPVTLEKICMRSFEE